MRKFTASCIDDITKKELVYSECGFNEVCMQLEKENADNKFGHFVSVISRTMYLTEIKFEKACFLHDDIRGVLLRA